MAKDILTVLAYLIMFTMMVSLANLFIGFVQIIEDLPTIRKRIWNSRSIAFGKLHRTRS